MIPNRTRAQLAKGTYDLSSGGDTFKIALFKASTEYSPAPDTHEFVDDVFDGGTTGEEMDDTNYSRQSVSGQAISQNDTDDVAEWDIDDVEFAGLGGSQTVEAVLIYRQIGGDDTTPGDDDIIRIIDDTEAASLEIATDGNDLEVVFDGPVLTI